jgi:hypothetical protein
VRASHDQDSKSLDLIWTAAEIAAFIKRTERDTYGLLERGHLPARRVGKQWVASRRALAEHFSATVAA